MGGVANNHVQLSSVGPIVLEGADATNAHNFDDDLQGVAWDGEKNEGNEVETNADEGADENDRVFVHVLSSRS